MKWKIPLFKIYWERDDVKAVSKVIKRGGYWAIGPEIEQFEKKIAEFVGRKHALVFNSGTSALHTLLLAHNIEDKEIIVPSFTFISTATSVVLARGKPIFAESEPKTLGLDAEDVRKRITSKTKAIIALHYGGFVSRDIEKLKKIADENNFLLIEDAAESFGACIGKKRAGSFGHSAIFSFCQNKIITTGEGGALVTDSEEVYQKAKLIRSHGRVEPPEGYFSSISDNDYVKFGYNLRMSAILAALGLSQLKKVNKIIKKRRNIAHYLTKALSNIDGITVLEEPENQRPVYQMYTIQLNNEKTRNALQDYLTKNGIMTKIAFSPIHLKTAYIKEYGYKEGDLPMTEAISKKVLTLPFYANLTKKNLKLMISTIEKFFNNKEGDLK